MKGTITMTFDGPKTKISVNVFDVGITDKCAIVDNLLESLNATGAERLTILALVAGNTEQEEEENKNESGRFGNQNV